MSDDFSVIVDENGISQGEKYDIGRIRLFGRVFMDMLTNAQFHLMNIYKMNDQGIEYLDKLLEEFKEEYKKQTGEELTIDRNQFIDLIRTNVRKQIQEILILASLIGAKIALKTTSISSTKLHQIITGRGPISCNKIFSYIFINT